MSGGDPVLQACVETWPVRPVIDVATTPYTREQLERRVNYWMERLDWLCEEPPARV